MRKIALLAASGITCIGLTVASTASPALASGQDGVLDSGEIAFYYNSYSQGSFVDIAHPKANLACCTFITSGAGQGQSVKNNTASVYNNRNKTARVYWGSNYTGAYDDVNPLSGRNLLNTYNDNASFQWLS